MCILTPRKFIQIELICKLFYDPTFDFVNMDFVTGDYGGRICLVNLKKHTLQLKAQQLHAGQIIAANISD
jgi:hypothetical protein